LVSAGSAGGLMSAGSAGGLMSAGSAGGRGRVREGGAAGDWVGTEFCGAAMGSDFEGTGGDFEGGVGITLVVIAWLDPPWSERDIDTTNVQKSIMGESCWGCRPESRMQRLVTIRMSRTSSEPLGRH
jgi:hypothetical protein